jgi:hypothetical protein
VAPPLSARALAALGAALSVLALLMSVTAGVDRWDEMWFLQVASRVAGGEALYRDVFFGSTPLGVWLAVPAVKLLGSEVLIVKGLTSIALGALGAALAAGACRAGVSTRSGVLMALAFVVFAGRLTIGSYVALAMAGAAWAVIAAAGARSTRGFVVAGALAGVAVASKYTVGLLALGVVGSVALSRGPERWRAAAATAGGSAAVVALSLVPVAVTGGLSRFAEYGFTAKGRYVDAGEVTYWESAGTAVLRIFEAVVAPSERNFSEALEAPSSLLPPLAALLAIIVWRRGGGTRTLALCALAAVAAVAGAYPRFSARHLGAALPASAALAAVALDAWLPRASRWRPALVAAVAVFALACVADALWPRWDDATLARAPHVRGVVVSAADLATWQADARALATAAASDGPLLVVSGAGGMLHVMSGVPNPTAYDYHFATAYGRTGERRVAQQVRRGEIPTVCLDPEIPERFRPLTLERAIRETLRPRRELGGCVLYGR